jgi:hypothetical protein
MDSTTLLPRPLHRSAAWLGRFEWLTIAALNDGTRRIGITTTDFPPYDGRLSQDEYNQLKETVNVLEYRKIDLAGFWTASKLFAGGIKAFKPTLEQCEAMANVDVNIAFADYRQPYPVICYDYPKEFAAKMAKRLGISRFPSHTVCHHDDKSGAINVTSVFAATNQIVGLLVPRAGIDTIEQSLRQYPDDLTSDDKDEFILAEMTQRIALNFSLLMSNTKFTKKFEDQKMVDKHRQMARAQNPDKRRRGQDFLLTDQEVIEFDQSVKFYGIEQEPQARSDGNNTGRHVKTHWRRGHWRNQPHGPLLSLRKQMFIAPIMVRKDLFVGDTFDTTVTYEGRNP